MNDNEEPVTVTAQSVMQTSDRVVDGGVTTVRSEPDGARKVATVIQLAVAEAGDLVTSIHINVTDITPSAGLGVSARDMSGFVSVDLGGSNVMRVELENGEAAIALDTSDLLGKVLTVTYSGDAAHASATRSMAF